MLVRIMLDGQIEGLLGYSSGDKAARIAWQRVSVQLTRAMDTIFRAVRDQQP